MFERFTDRARKVLTLAEEEASRLSHNFVGTEHILLGLIREEEGVAATALESLGISLLAAREKVKETVGPAASDTPSALPFTPRAKKVLELSLRESLQLGHNYIGTEHLLLGLVREGEGVGAQVLVSLGTDLSGVRQQVIELLSGYQGKAEGEGPRAPAGRRLDRAAGYSPPPIPDRLRGTVQALESGLGRPGQWYVVHTYAGYEHKVKSNLESRISSMNMQERIHEVVIPLEDVVEFKAGREVVVPRKVFPGYLLVRCEMDDDWWSVIRNTPGVLGFVGT